MLPKAQLCPGAAWPWLAVLDIQVPELLYCQLANLPNEGNKSSPQVMELLQALDGPRLSHHSINSQGCNHNISLLKTALSCLLSHSGLLHSHSPGSSPVPSTRCIFPPHYSLKVDALPPPFLCPHEASEAGFQDCSFFLTICQNPVCCTLFVQGYIGQFMFCVCMCVPCCPSGTGMPLRTRTLPSLSFYCPQSLPLPEETLSRC